ncbi:MAG: hypothetical protein KKH44_04845 [Bacteroidetes bacterium]|nr:hypothetical protein [Bacteroidota bacterium]
MDNNEKCKTTEIRVLIDEAESTGLISEETLKALEHEKLLAQEKVKNLERLYKEDIISYEQMQTEIKNIRAEMSRRILDLDFDT